MNTKVKPIVSWGVWAIGLSLVMGLVTHKFILAGFRADGTGMSFVIALLFVFGLAASFRAALQLHTEWGILDKVIGSKKIPQGNGKSGLADIFTKLAEYKRLGQTVDVHAAIETYHAGHNARVRSISIMAALLISMGLLGTIIGLIMAISGLGGMVENIGLSKATMMDALKTTVAGMGTAFYTTFFGALGGLILRAVAVSQLNSLSVLCAAASEYADANLVAKLESKEDELNQKMTKVVESFENMQVEIDSVTQRIATSIDTSMVRFGEALEATGKKAMESTEECVVGMTEEMKVFSAEMGTSFGAFNESVVKSGEEVEVAVAAINTSIESSGAGLQEAFGGLNGMIVKSGEGLSDAFDGLDETVKTAGETVAGSLADFKLSIDSTSSELNDAVGELHTAITQATGEMVTMAKAKLDTEANEIAGQLAMAASSIQSFVAKKAAHQIESESDQRVA